MKKTFLLIAINFILVGTWLIRYNQLGEQKDFNINITVSEDTSGQAVDEVKEALSYVSEQVLDSFVEEDWKIVILSSEDSVPHGECQDASVVGVIDFDNNTITVKEFEDLEGATKNVVIHEMAHYVDRCSGNLSAKGDFEILFENYKDAYIPYSYAGIEITSKNVKDVMYSSSTPKEFFAETYKDYVLHKDYLEENYSEIATYFEILNANSKTILSNRNRKANE